ncbi:MAG: DUF2092 domain-containing protein [Myxococcota bacterium]
MRRKSMRRVALTFCAALSAGPVGAQAPAEAPTAEPASDVDPAALAIASRAGDFLRQSQRFTFSADSGYEVVQEDGAKLEFGSARRYAVQRPDHVRVETEPREGDRRLTLFDGKTLTQVDLGENVYARADLKQPRDIDFVIDLVRDRLDAPLPLAELLRNNPRQAIEDSLELAELVGAERLRGVDCDHIALRNPDADVQLWIARGERPVVLRVVITYRNLDGQPSFWADLDDWSFDPKLSADEFTYRPPEGAERVRFDVRPAPAPPTEGTP